MTTQFAQKLQTKFFNQHNSLLEDNISMQCVHGLLWSLVRKCQRNCLRIILLWHAF